MGDVNQEFGYYSTSPLGSRVARNALMPWRWAKLMRKKSIVLPRFKFKAILIRSKLWRHSKQVIGAVKFPLYGRSIDIFSERSVRLLCLRFSMSARIYVCKLMSANVAEWPIRLIYSQIPPLFCSSFWMRCPFLIPNFDPLLSLINTVHNNKTNLNILLRNENWFAARHPGWQE